MRKTFFSFLISLSLTALAQTPQQYVLFRVTPKEDVKVVLNGEELPFRDGTASKRMPFGTYAYSVEAPMYHAVSGTVTVNDPQGKHVVSLDLKPAYGYLSIPAEGALSGARVYLDDVHVGKVPYKSGRLASGEHWVHIDKEMYSSVTQQVTVEDGKTTTFSPQLSGNFANLTFVVQKDAEIWMNGEYMGVGRWSGQMECGSYDIECRKKNHRSTMLELRVTSDMTGRTITLDAPSAIMGSLDISSSPADATVFLDGERVGTTPMIMDGVVVGKHKVMLSKSGYLDMVSEVTLTEGNTCQVEMTLTKGQAMTFGGYDSRAGKYAQEIEQLRTLTGELKYPAKFRMDLYHLKKRLDTDATREAYDILKTVDASDAPAQIVKKIKEVIGKLQEL